MDHLYEAAFHNQEDKLHGISDCLTFGKTVPLGTGMHSILWNKEAQAKKGGRQLRKRPFMMVA